jgi:predicted  nucleic acid-binding Zn-ribbon protein
MLRPQLTSSSRARRWKLAMPALMLALSASFGTAQATSEAAKPAYAIVLGDEQHISISGDDRDWPDLKGMRRSAGGEFLWFREGGKSWIVQDAGVLAKARAAYAPLERLGKQMDAQGQEMNRHGKAMDALGKDMQQAVAGVQPDGARMAALQTRMNELGRQMGSLGRQLGQASDDGERSRLEAQMSSLDAQMSTLGAQMGEAADSAGQRAARQHMEEVSQRMDEAGKPMDGIGRQMKALGKQMKQESEAADKTVRALIRDAIARGLARSAPHG